MTVTNWGQQGTIPSSVRRAVRRRDGDQCQLRYPGCIGIYQQLDHRDNLASRGVRRIDDKPTAEDLQCVCVPCHKIKTSAEAQRGRGLAPRHVERDHRLGTVDLPSTFRYRPSSPASV